MNAQISKKRTFIIPLIIGILIAGALIYYFWPQLQQKSSEVPPSITISSSKFQGSISGGDVCKIKELSAFTGNQVNSYTKPGTDNSANWNILENGVHIYHAGVDMTVQQIMNAIVPTIGNKIMIAYYPADTENVEKKFVTYPAIAGQTAINDPATYIIPKYQGFAIFSCQDTKIWKVRTEKMGASILTTILNTKDAGWILIPGPDGQDVVPLEVLPLEVLPVMPNDYPNKIKSTWIQKGAGFNFQKVDNMDNAKLIGDWKMIWLKIGPVEQQAPAAIPQTINIIKNEGLNKQVVIEWTDTPAQPISQYLIFRSKQPNVAAACPENCQYVNSDPPGNLVGNISADHKKLNDKLLLEDETTYYYVIKSQNVDESKVVGTSAEFSVKTLSAEDMSEVMAAMDEAAAEIKANMDAAAKSMSGAFGGM